jgi:hypothetical protein
MINTECLLLLLLLGRNSNLPNTLFLSLLSHRACCYACYIIQLIHFVTLQNALTLTFKNTKMLKACL